MQRRQVANSPDEHVEMVNLLHTAVRDEYKKPPPAERIKDFIRHNYTLPHLVPSTKVRSDIAWGMRICIAHFVCFACSISFRSLGWAGRAVDACLSRKLKEWLARKLLR